MSFARALFQSSNEAGPIGPTGPTGPAGPAVAPAGGAGTIGATGPAGVAGPAGSPGIVGATGPAGSIGPAGPAGIVGATGPAGTVGAAGIVGATGPAGTVGATGTVGAPGTVGATGPAGSAASIGATGPTGPAGGGSGSGSNTSLAVNYYLPMYDATQQEYYRIDLARINMPSSNPNLQIKYNLNISIPFNALGDSKNYQFWDSGEVFFSGGQAGAGPGFNTNDSSPYYVNNPNNGLCYMNRYIGGVNPGPLYVPANVNTQMGTLWFEYIPSNSYITCWFWSSPDYWVKSDGTTPYQQSVICNLNLQILNDGNATLPTTNYTAPPAGIDPIDPGPSYVVSLSPAGGIVNPGYASP